jgi:hypothetical protein
VRPLTGRERVAVAIWLVVPIVIWNVIYDLLLTRGVNDYLFRAALHEAGRGPATSMAEVMDRTVYDAVWVSTLFASIVALAGFFTIRYLRQPPNHVPRPDHGVNIRSTNVEP